MTTAFDPDDEMDVVLRGKSGDVTLQGALTTTDYTQTIEVGTTVTITVVDQKRVLLTSGLLDTNSDGRLDRAVDLTLDGYAYRLAIFEKDGDQFTLTFEDRLANTLKHTHGHIKPKNTSDVAFVKRLVGTVGGTVVVPTGVPDVASKDTHAATAAARAASDDRREPGIPGGADLKIRDATGKTYKASASQLRVAEKLISVAKQLGAGEKATLALVMAGMVESEFKNSSKIGDPGSTSVGVLQAQYGLSRGYDGSTMTKEQCVDIVYTAKSFLGNPGDAHGGFASKGSAQYLAKQHPDWTAGQIAQAVEASRYPARYDAVRNEAKAIVAAYEGGAINDGSSGGATASAPGGGRSPVQVGTPENPNESFWTAIQRIAEPRGYRFFVLHNKAYYGSEQDFIRSRARMTISEQSAGVDWINGTWAPNTHINTATVTCRASLWAAPPGSPVVVTDTGPLNGRWLVSSFSRSRYDKQAIIEMRRGTELLKPEPVTSSSAGGTTTTASAAAAGADTASMGDVKADPGNGTYVQQTTRPDGKRVLPNKGLQAFLRLLAGAVGQTLYTNTYSRHGQYAASGNQSDHWTGDAADIHSTPPLDSKLGDKICYHALRLAGVPDSVASGLSAHGCNFPNYTWEYQGQKYRVQVGWRVADHHDHVHVGVKPL